MASKKRIWRVLFVGDTHMDNRTPSMRKDDYMQAGLAELFETLQIAEERHVDVWIHAGDVFHRMEPHGECRNAVLSRLQADDHLQPWPFRKLALIGNHDVHHNPQNLENSALGTLVKAGALEIVDAVQEMSIGFAHFRASINEEIQEGLFERLPYRILCSHSSIVTIPIFGSHILFEDVQSHPDCKLLLTGHVHSPMRAVRADGVEFINPGSVCRNALNQENLERKPQVLYLEYSEDWKHYKAELIPLTSSQPAASVFKIEEAQIKRERDADTKQYIQQISKTQMTVLGSGNDLVQSLRQSGKIRNIPIRVIDLAIEYIQSAGQAGVD